MKPAPDPDETTSFYWRGATDAQLLVSRCRPYGHLSHPPDVTCPYCGSTELAPVEMSGRGTVYSFTVVRQAFSPAFLADVPYAVGLVELDEQAGLRVLTNLVEVAVDDIEVGMPVEVTFEERDGHTVPQFRPVAPTRGES